MLKSLCLSPNYPFNIFKIYHLDHLKYYYKWHKNFTSIISLTQYSISYASTNGDAGGIESIAEQQVLP